MLLYSIEKFLWDEKTFAFWVCAYISIQFCTLATFLLVFTIDVKSYWTVMTVLVLKKQISSQLQICNIICHFRKERQRQVNKKALCFTNITFFVNIRFNLLIYPYIPSLYRTKNILILTSYGNIGQIILYYFHIIQDLFWVMECCEINLH